MLFRSLSSSQIGTLTASQFDGLGVANLGSLTTGQISGVTTTQIGALSTTQLRDGSLLYLIGVAPEQDANTYETTFRRVRQNVQINDR